MDPNKDNLESFGQYLMRERQLREISLEEIAGYTRIKLRALKAIEEDDFASLPPLAFARAFIRCYADYIGLNVPDAMLRFDAFIQSRYPELTGEMPIIPKKTQPKQGYVPLVIIILVVLLSVFFYWLSGSQKTPAPTTPEPPSPKSAIKAGRGPLPPTTAVLERDDLEDESGSGAGQDDSTEDRETQNDHSTGSDGTGHETTGDETSPASGHSESDTKDPEPQPRIPPASGDRGEVDSGQQKVKEEKPSIPWTSEYSAALGPPLDLAVFQEQARDTREDDLVYLRDYDQSIQHRVTITVDENCWVQYYIDEETARVAILQPDHTVTFQAFSSVKVKIGHPDGVASVLYNDQPFDYRPCVSPWWLNFPPSPQDNICP